MNTTENTLDMVIEIITKKMEECRQMAFLANKADRTGLEIQYSGGVLACQELIDEVRDAMTVKFRS